MIDRPLRNLTVMLSASVPDEYMGKDRSLDLFSLLKGLISCILDGGGGVVFGGHPSVVAYAHAAALKAGPDNDGVHIYQLRRVHKDPVHRSLVECMLKLEGHTDEEVKTLDLEDSKAFRSVNWFPELPRGVGAELEQMRRAMAERSQAAVFSGGRTTGFYGEKPGIQQEYEIFREVHASKAESVYLTGILGGATLDLIKKNEADAREPNSLGPYALIEVRQSDNPDLVCGLIIADLMKFAARLRRDSKPLPSTTSGPDSPSGGG
jgi:SLOG cluster2